MAERLTDVEPLGAVLGRRPLALLTDMDGTLSPIVDRAEDAYVPAEVKEALAGLAGRGVHVFVVTGRSLEVARRMVDVEGVGFAAGHGVDLWVGGEHERPPAAEKWAGRARQALAELRGVEKESGVWIEDKEFGLAVHYRAAEDEEAARESILAAVRGSAAAREFEVQEGRKIVELRPRLAANKGTAAAMLLERSGAAGAVCLGDDITDIDMFREVRRLREGGTGGVIVAVRSEEASAEVLRAADCWVDGVDGVAWLLGEMVRRLS